MSSQRSRLFHLDNLRIYLTILVILHHTAIAYGAGGDWAVVDPAVDEISPIFLTFFTAVNQSYFISIFFLLAGYFTPRSFEKKGTGVFVRDRLIRLGVPLIVYTTVVININQLTLGVWLHNEPFRWRWDYEPGHLWFLQALLLFALIYVLYRRWSDSRQVQNQFFQNQFPPNRALTGSVLALTLLTFLVRIFFPVGEWVYGFQLAHFAHYTFSFFVGILARRGDWFNRLAGAQARRWGNVALVMLPLFFVLAIGGGALEGDEALGKFLGGLHWQSFAYSAWESVMFIAVTTYLLFIFRERFNITNTLLRTMASSVYTVYIIHQSILIAINVLFLDLAIPTILKFIIAPLIVVPTCFLLAGIIRKIPYADRVLG
jgi:glucan biosynthesis protein C